MKKTKVVQQEGKEEVPAEVVAQSIKKLSDAVEQMNKSGLSEKAIRLLLRHGSGESDRAVCNVLGALRNLKQDYLK